MIDVSFDFTTDTKGYWNGYWDNGLGWGGKDPDKESPTLTMYHQLLWSKKLPNGEIMELKQGKWKDYDYLFWRDMRFASDTIIVEFRHEKYRHILNEIAKIVDFRSYYEDLLRKSYTIGGTIIFPKHPRSMNQAKGCNPHIVDRWDLTLECIRRYYNGEDSPLYKTILSDKAFFDLFVDFKGYVDFFFLQDCVSNDYASVDLWCGDTYFEKSGYPKTVEEYFQFIEKELEFLNKRNQRIKEYSLKNGL